MELTEHNGNGNAVLNIEAKDVKNEIRTIVNKKTYNIKRAKFTSQPGPSGNKVRILESQWNQGTVSSEATSLCTLRQKLQELYKKYTLPKVAWLTEGQALPLDEYYVELELSESSQLIKIEQIFDQTSLLTKKPSRILIEGQPGYGKTTMATKLAFDWANDEKYIDFKLVFLFPLRELQDQTIKDCIAIIGKRCGFKRKKIMKIVKENQKDVLFIFDGLDELSAEGRLHIAQILHNQQFCKVTVVAFGRTDSFTLMPEERQKLFGLANADDKYHDKQLSILGIRDEEKKEEFIKKFLLPSMDQNIIESLDLQLDLFDSPLFLILLPVIVHENDYVQPTSKTDFYKQLFNCIIKQSCKNRARHLDLSFDLFHLESSRNYIQDIVYKFGKLCLEKLMKNNLQFESDDLMQDVYDIGLLSKHSEINKFDRKNDYEAFHTTIIEFSAAVALWMAFKFDRMTFAETHLQPFVPFFMKTAGISLVIPFLRDLMDKDWSLMPSIITQVCVEYIQMLNRH